ncbi:DUF3533 domain-containing protein (plasmid) [Cytobacillus firmus]|nr:DUF3533 domain-containing protein [Cytobacillus firmus]USK41835.1 DUF3533 domain-containing protein [Cytobacillus firmus]
MNNFFTRQAINILMSIFLSLVTVSFLTIFNVDLHTTFIETWGFQALTFFSFLCFSQLFVIIFGNPGMLFNIIALSLQLVTCGVIVPLNMLPDFFQNVGGYLPATYVANGYYTIIYGAGELSSNAYWLLGIAGITLVVSLAKTILFSKVKKVAGELNVA